MNLATSRLSSEKRECGTNGASRLEDVRELERLRANPGHERPRRMAMPTAAQLDNACEMMRAARELGRRAVRARAEWGTFVCVRGSVWNI